MYEEILRHFPPFAHPLNLVSDPDRLLASEAVMFELVQRGFQVIQENDPVLLRHRVEEVRPFTAQHPVIVITTGALEDLPFDLYQPAYRLTLSLHQFFPKLAYPVLQTLSPNQVEKLGSSSTPIETLSRQKTIDFLLQEVFNADLIALNQSHALVVWLNDYHQSQSPLPELLRLSLVEHLKRYPIYRDWELDALIREAQSFSDFIQNQWQISVDQAISGKRIREYGSGYHLFFEREQLLQDIVPALVRQGTLKPLEILDNKGLPNWTHSGVTLTDARVNRITLLLEKSENWIRAVESAPTIQTSWTELNGFALDWAELCSLQYQTDLEVNHAQRETFRKLGYDIDRIFSIWLRKNYTPLGAQCLPMPHHVHHIPHFLAYLRNLGQVERIVLLVLDGLSLTDWQVIKSVWTKRHALWEIKTQSLLAQVPTLTSISRYALISGLRPVDFANNFDHCAPEARAWELFWSREGMTDNTCKLLSLSFDRGFDHLPELQDPRVSFWCLVEDTPDKLAHNATLGAPDQQSSLRLWLDPAHEQNSIQLEDLIDSYLDRGYSVFIASDHGHVEATGIGQPSEGLLAQTRGKRARIYMDRLAAIRIQNSFPDTILWGNDGVLPDQMAALMPKYRDAFAPSGEVVVTHGGISIDEVVVPFIQISKESS